METVIENNEFNAVVEKLAAVIAKEKLFSYHHSPEQEQHFFEEAFKAYGESAGSTHFKYKLTQFLVALEATVEMVDVQTDGIRITMTPKITAINALSLDTGRIDPIFCHMFTRRLRQTASLPLEN